MTIARRGRPRTRHEAIVTRSRTSLARYHRRSPAGDGGLIPTLAFAVPTALAGTLAYTGPGMAGADTTAVPAGDTALVVAIAVRAVITRSADLTAALVVARAVASVVIAASAAATAVDIADHDRQALAGVLIGYDRRGWHGQHRRHEVDRWNNGSRRQQWLWRRSQQRWNHNNWRNERDRRNECDRWNEGKWWNNWRGRRNQQRWKQNG